MIVSLIKIGCISIKNKLGVMPSKQDIFAGLPPLQYQQVELMLRAVSVQGAPRRQLWFRRQAQPVCS